MCIHPGASQAGHYSKLVICYKLCKIWIFLEIVTYVYIYLLVIIRWEKWQSIKKNNNLLKKTIKKPKKKWISNSAVLLCNFIALFCLSLFDLGFFLQEKSSKKVNSGPRISRKSTFQSFINYLFTRIWQFEEEC